MLGRVRPMKPSGSGAFFFGRFQTAFSSFNRGGTVSSAVDVGGCVCQDWPFHRAAGLWCERVLGVRDPVMFEVCGRLHFRSWCWSLGLFPLVSMARGVLILFFPKNNFWV